MNVTERLAEEEPLDLIMSTLGFEHSIFRMGRGWWQPSVLISVRQHYIPPLEQPLYNCLMEIYVFFSLDPIIYHLWHDLSENDRTWR